MSRFRNRVLTSLAVAAILLTFSPAAFAGPDNCEWFGLNTWVFKSGQTGYSYNCNFGNGTASYQAAKAYAEAQCQNAWDNFAAGQADTNSFQTFVYSAPTPGDPMTLRWYYRCTSCIDGMFAYEPDQHVQPVGVGTAGDNATGVVDGVVQKIELVRNDKDDEDYYLVDILSSEAITQVRVSAETGEASIVDGGQPAQCRIQ